MSRSAVTLHKPHGNRRFAGSRFFIVLLSFTAGLLLAGCGYHLARPGNNLPPQIKRLAIPVLKNDTMEPGLEAKLTDELRRRFAESGWVSLADADQADAVLLGTVTKFKTAPISFSTSDYAVEYRAQLRVSIRLIDRDQVVLWSDDNLVKVREYRAVADIFESEANKTAAIDWLAREVSADVHDRIFDGFE